MCHGRDEPWCACGSDTFGRMADDPSPRRPETGWALGAGGLPKPVWGGVTVLLLVLGVVLLVTGYIGYGALILIIGAAAAVNVL